MEETTTSSKETVVVQSDSKPDMPMNNGGMKGLIMGLVALIVLVGVGYGLYMWMGGSQNTSMTPAERTDAVAGELTELESYKYSVELKPAFGPELQSELNNEAVTSLFNIKEPVTGLAMTMSGVMGINDGKSLASMDMKVRLDTEKEQGAASVGMNANLVNGVAYLKMQPLPELVMTTIESQLGLDLAFIEDQWMKLDPQEIKEVAQQFGASEEDLTQFTKALEPMSDEDEEALRTAFKDHPFVELKEKLTTEEVDGVKVDKYSVGMNYGEMKAFLEAIKPILKKYEMTDEDFDALLKNLDEETIKKEMKDVKIDVAVWVGVKDNQIYKVEMTMKPTDEVDTEELQSITATVMLSDHNQAVSVEEPQDAMTLKELIGEFTTQAASRALEGVGAEEPAPEEPTAQPL